MSYRTKIFFLCSGFLTVLVHFTFVFFYRQAAVPKSKIDFYSLAYVYPFFQQSWQLFAPPPSANYHLFAKFDLNGEQKKIDLFQEIVLAHQSNRLAGHEYLVIAFTNAIHYFEKNTTEVKPLNGPLQNDQYFSIVEHAAKAYVNYRYGGAPRNLKLILLVDDVAEQQQRAYYN